eukprot:TRINITY_DN21564_c1_g1_i1.p1 TRINITY_DN21564_c1_g1~~TRINITY_DN21564_c1_g1_i1.p1  ORF type:complete len:192 (-),score=33.06 TRINITY_DN21564_c1_g1_i1:46-621(-)
MWWALESPYSPFLDWTQQSKSKLGQSSGGSLLDASCSKAMQLTRSFSVPGHLTPRKGLGFVPVSIEQHRRAGMSRYPLWNHARPWLQGTGEDIPMEAAIPCDRTVRQPVAAARSRATSRLTAASSAGGSPHAQGATTPAGSRGGSARSRTTAWGSNSASPASPSPTAAALATTPSRRVGGGKRGSLSDYVG